MIGVEDIVLGVFGSLMLGSFLVGLKTLVTNISKFLSEKSLPIGVGLFVLGFLGVLAISLELDWNFITQVIFALGFIVILIIVFFKFLRGD